MDEQIKTVRSAYQTLMVLCTLLLVVALSASRGTQYRAALEEITSGMKLLNATNWREVSSKAVDAEAEDYIEEVRKVWRNLSLSPVPSDLRASVPLKQSEIYIPSADTVDNLLVTFDDLAVRYFYPDFVSLEQVITRENILLLPDDVIEIRKFYRIHPFDQNDLHVVNHEELLPSVDSIVSADAQIDIWNEANTTPRTVLIFNIKGELKTAEISNDTIRDLQDLFRLTGPVNEKGEMFSATKSVWQQIKGRSLTEVRADLLVQDEVDIYPDPVSILGITIPGEHIVIAAPVATLVILLYMLVYLLQLSRSRDALRDDKYRSLWFGLFDSKLAWAIVAVTIVILPAASNFLLVRAIYNIQYASAVAPVIALLSIFVWFRILYITESNILARQPLP